MIGAKTLAILGLVIAVVAAAIGLGVLAPERLMALGEGTLLLIGCFGAVVGTLIFRLWRLGERSRHYFRWTSESAAWDVNEGHFLGGERRRIALGVSEDRGDDAPTAFDLSRRMRHAMSVLIASLLALVCLDARTLEKLGGAGKGLASVTSSYCPEEEPKKPLARDPNEPGCELVRRAYALGYAKSLGMCAPKVEASTDAPRLPCARRQRDEPVLHYSWRLLSGFWSDLRMTARLASVQKARQDFRARASRLGALGNAQKQILTSAPHASHHVWTNLPDPGDGAFRETTCSGKYLRLAHRPTPPPGATQASKVFEHVVAQLLFEGTYDVPAGHCREYHVHWGAPLDACTRLVSDPEAFLASADSAADDVRAVLERDRVAREVASLGAPRAAVEGGARAPEPSSFVSFQCYFEGDPGERKSTPLSFAGHHFTVEEVRIAPSSPNATLYIDRYHAIAQLLVRGFHYGRLLSEAGLEQGAAVGLEAAFSSSDHLLTRLFELESIDIYLDPGWLAQRPDLLEVYPYERHLKNYVQTFRRQYRRERGRL